MSELCNILSLTPLKSNTEHTHFSFLIDNISLSLLHGLFYEQQKSLVYLVTIYVLVLVLFALLGGTFHFQYLKGDTINRISHSG